MIPANKNITSKTSVIRKKLRGQVQHNDGEFAEVQLVGIEGVEENLLGEIIQIHRCETENNSMEFGRQFPVGIWLDIMTATEITPISKK
jgi:hypothetical protein